jgi:hypothetical protein
MTPQSVMRDVQVGARSAVKIIESVFFSETRQEVTHVLTQFFNICCIMSTK